MGALLNGLGALSAAAAELLVGSVWKGVILVVCVAMLLRCLPRPSAAARSALWTTVLLAVLLLPVLSLVERHSVSTGSNSGLTIVHAGVAWSWSIAGIWFAMSLIRSLQLIASILRLRKIAAGATPVQASDGVATLLQLSGRRVSLCVSPEVSRPSVAGFFSPRILLPMGLLESLSAAELEHVVRHELEHLRRRDDWSNLLQKLSLAVFPLHPAVLWIDRRLCVERELACDDGVLRMTGAHKAYAACLARLAEDSITRRGLLLALGLLGGRPRRSELSERVHRILRGPAAALNRAQIAISTAVLLSGLVGGSFLLGRSPRLISFAGDRPARVAASDGLPNLHKRVPRAAALMAASSAMAAGKASGSLVLAKAVMSHPSSPASAVIPASTGGWALKHAGRGSKRRTANAPYLVYTTWEGQAAAPHLILAATGDPQVYSAGAAWPPPHTFHAVQTTYAAVPLRGGWLLIEL